MDYLKNFVSLLVSAPCGWFLFKFLENFTVEFLPIATDFIFEGFNNDQTGQETIDHFLNHSKMNYFQKINSLCEYYKLYKEELHFPSLNMFANNFK